MSHHYISNRDQTSKTWLKRYYTICFDNPSYKLNAFYLLAWPSNRSPVNCNSCRESRESHELLCNLESNNHNQAAWRYILIEISYYIVVCHDLPIDAVQFTRTLEGKNVWSLNDTVKGETHTTAFTAKIQIVWIDARSFWGKMCFLFHPWRTVIYTLAFSTICKRPYASELQLIRINVQHPRWHMRGTPNN